MHRDRWSWRGARQHPGTSATTRSFGDPITGIGRGTRIIPVSGTIGHISATMLSGAG